MALLMLWGGQAMAQSAVVDNGSDPSSRLNMRDQPSKDAGSVGQFYTGTPVEIVSDAGGGWSQVTIGGGANSLSGYMMSQYLSTDTASVQDATKDMQVVSPYGTQSVVVRDTPSLRDISLWLRPWRSSCLIRCRTHTGVVISFPPENHQFG